MAKKNPSILGEPHGKIGDYVFKERNGKTYISKAAKTYTPSQLPHEKDKRNKQKVNGKFSSVINKSPLLHAVWEKEKAPCTTAYNKINKVNYPLCEPDHPSAEAQITPGGFKLEVEEISPFPGRIEVVPLPFELRKEETNIAYIMILSLWNKRRKKDNDFEFLLRLRLKFGPEIRVSVFCAAQKKIFILIINYRFLKEGQV